MKKKVIFITGASHSGSTLVGCVLGAHKKNPFTYFHIGEAHAFFDIKSKKYGNPRAAGKTAAGRIWHEINYQLGYENAYQEIFKKTDAQIIIDSSKSMKNFDIIQQVSEKKGWPVYIVITYRPFVKIWQSDIKRQVKESRTKKNIHTYRAIKEQIVDRGFNCAIVNIEQLILSPREMTATLCDTVGLPYFDGKEYYWNFPACHLYGSPTQRRHIKKPEEAKYDISKVKAEAEITHPFLEKEDVRELDNYFMANSLKPGLYQKRRADTNE